VKDRPPRSRPRLHPNHSCTPCCPTPSRDRDSDPPPNRLGDIDVEGPEGDCWRLVVQDNAVYVHLDKERPGRRPRMARALSSCGATRSTVSATHSASGSAAHSCAEQFRKSSGASADQGEDEGAAEGDRVGKTRHKNPRTALRYVKPSPKAIAKVTEALATRRRTH
jgi:hypothetical protein